MAPLMIAYLALMAASTAASAAAQRKTNKERAKVFAEARQRRSNRDQKADAFAQATMNEVGRTKEKEGERAAELAELYRRPTTANATPNAASTRFLDPVAATGDAETIANVGAARERSTAEHNRRTSAFAKLGAFDDVNAENALLAARNQQDIGIENGLLEGWQNTVLPAITHKANIAGRQWASAADAMKLVATVMAPYALSAAPAAGSASGGNVVGAADIGAGAAGGQAFDPYEMLRKIRLRGMGLGGL